MLSADSLVHIATSLLLLAAGVGAWRARRESVEVVTARDLAKLDATMQHELARLKADLTETCRRLERSIDEDRRTNHRLRNRMQFVLVQQAIIRTKLGIPEPHDDGSDTSLS